MGLYEALARRSPRERRLLALMALVLCAAAAWFLLVPLVEARRAAEQRKAEEQALLVWVAARAEEFSGLAPAAATGSPEAPIGMSGLEESLVVARLREKVSRLSAESDGGIVLAFDSVEFTRLMTWLSAISQRWGYRLDRFTLSRTEIAGSVRADMALVPATE